jgi:hypothetical protein
MVSIEQAQAQFRNLNDNGAGFAPSSKDVNECKDLGRLVYAAQSDRDIAVYRDGDKVYAVGDCNGPWAVRVA